MKSTLILVDTIGTLADTVKGELARRWDCITEWVDVCVNVWVSLWVNVWVKECVRGVSGKEWVAEWVNVWVTD